MLTVQGTLISRERFGTVWGARWVSTVDFWPVVDGFIQRWEARIDLLLGLCTPESCGVRTGFSTDAKVLYEDLGRLYGVRRQSSGLSLRIPATCCQLPTSVPSSATRTSATIVSNTSLT
jgi:hypothetical protein